MLTVKTWQNNLQRVKLKNMKTIKITPKLLNEYSTILNEVDRKIYDLGIVLRQKNLADLTFVIKRLDSFKDIYDESLFDKAVEELKSKKLGKSFNEIQLIICSDYLLKPIEKLIEENIIHKQKLNIDDWITNIDADLDNDDDLIYMVHKFTFWTLLLTRSLTLIWDKKDSRDFPKENFLELNVQANSLYFKTQKDVEQFLERNKSKTRIALFKFQGIQIESASQNALGYLKRLTNSFNS
jgi:hypothetical protein